MTAHAGGPTTARVGWRRAFGAPPEGTCFERCEHGLSCNNPEHLTLVHPVLGVVFKPVGGHLGVRAKHIEAVLVAFLRTVAETRDPNPSSTQVAERLDGVLSARHVRRVTRHFGAQSRTPRAERLIAA